MTVGMGAALGILGVHAVMDIRKRHVNLILAGICLAAGAGWQIFVQKAELWELLLSCLPGALLLGTAGLTQQKIGYGDGWVVAAAGVWTGMWDIFLILAGGMFACAAFSGILLAMKKVRKGDSLPFIPFLLIGWVGRILL